MRIRPSNGFEPERERRAGRDRAPDVRVVPRIDGNVLDDEEADRRTVPWDIRAPKARTALPHPGRGIAISGNNPRTTLTSCELPRPASHRPQTEALMSGSRAAPRRSSHSREKAWGHCCGRETDIEVLGGATTLAEAIASRFDPDVIVAEVVLPGSRRDEIIGTLRARFPSAAILMLTAACTPEDIYGALAEGASGYILKEVDATELLAAVRHVAGGEQHLEPEDDRAPRSGEICPWGSHPSREHGRRPPRRRPSQSRDRSHPASVRSNRRASSLERPSQAGDPLPGGPGPVGHGPSQRRLSDRTGVRPTSF